MAQCDGRALPHRQRQFLPLGSAENGDLERFSRAVSHAQIDEYFRSGDQVRFAINSQNHIPDFQSGFDDRFGSLWDEELDGERQIARGDSPFRFGIRCKRVEKQTEVERPDGPAP